MTHLSELEAEREQVIAEIHDLSGNLDAQRENLIRLDCEIAEEREYDDD